MTTGSTSNNNDRSSTTPVGKPASIEDAGPDRASEPILLSATSANDDDRFDIDDATVTISSAVPTVAGELQANSLNHDAYGPKVTFLSSATHPPHEGSRLLYTARTTMKHPVGSWCHSWLGQRKLTVDLLVILFGIGSWLGVNAVYVQLPLLVAHAPEGWSLPSYLVIVIQIANVGPLAYTLVQRLAPRRLSDSALIYAIFAIGLVAAVCMATMYRMTALVAGQSRSVALLAITFFFAFIGCTSSVLFMPYMGRFREIYLITYLIGEGLSGLLPSLLALVQGVGGNTECVPGAEPAEFVQYTPPPRFGSDAFFYCVLALMALSAIAFGLLDRLKLCRSEYESVTIRNGNDYEYERKQPPEPANGNADASTGDSKLLSPTNYVLLMFLMAAASLLGSGIFPGIQSYSALPYGNLAYHLTITLGAIANPLSCFLAVFLPHKSIRQISMLSALMGALSAYALATALLSPDPPLHDSWTGEMLVVITWVVLSGLVSYIKLSITSIFRYQGGQSLVWIGAISQAGSAIGAVITFCLVNMTGVFVAYQPC